MIGNFGFDAISHADFKLQKVKEEVIGVVEQGCYWMSLSSSICYNPLRRS